MRVFLTNAAERDLEDIADWIARDSPQRAISFVDELVDRCQRIGDTPRAFPIVRRYAEQQIRRRVFGAYLIFYRVDPDRVTVLHILHGARDYEPLLFPDDGG